MKKFPIYIIADDYLELNVNIIILSDDAKGGKRLDNEKSRITAQRCVIAISAVLALILFFDKLLGVLIPIGTAYFISSALRPAASYISKKSRISSKICGGVIVVFAVFAVIYALFCAGSKLIYEMTSFVKSVVNDLDSEENIIRRVIEFLGDLRNRIPIFSKLANNGGENISDEIYSTLIGVLRSAVKNISQSVTGFAANIIGALPKFIFSVVVSLIGIFYFTMDFDGVKSGFLSLMPESAVKKITHLGCGITGALSGYIRAYFVLLLLTFGELFLGFIILRVKYAFFLSALIAVIDILPVFGVGTVLLPWTAVLFISGESGQALGLLILFGIMYVVRQFAEPRLIGKFMGIHPLIALCAAYTGYRIFGVAGMIMFPILLYIIKLLMSAEKNIESSHQDNKKGGSA